MNRKRLQEIEQELAELKASRRKLQEIRQMAIELRGFSRELLEKIRSGA